MIDHSGYDSVEKVIEKLLSWHQMCEQHSRVIKHGPNEGNLKAYCDALKDIKTARQELKELNIENHRVVGEALSSLDEEGTDKLGSLFGELLQSCSEPIELNMSTLSGYTPSQLDDKLAERLSLIASFLAEEEKPARLYVDVRGKYIILSVQPLLSMSCPDPLSYQRGSHPMIICLRALKDLLIPVEREMITKVLPNTPGLLEKALKPVATIFLGHLNLIGRECLSGCDGQNHRFLEFIYLFDVLEELYSSIRTCSELSNSFQICFQTLLDYCKQWFERLSSVISQHSFGAPENSGIYQGTTLAMTCLSRLSDYETISEAILNSLEEVKSSRSTTSTASFLHPDSVIAISFFFKQTLTNIEENFIKTSRLYARPLKTNLFLLNNYNYMAGMVMSNERLAALVPAGVEKNLADKIKVIMTALEEAWQRLANLLKNPQNTPKDDYKMFTNELMEQLNVSGQVVIPDEDLRITVRQLLQRTILPTLQAFFHQHQALFVSSTSFRSARLDPDTVAEMINKMFEG